VSLWQLVWVRVCVCAGVGVGVGVGAGAGKLLCVPVCGIAGPNLIMFRMSHQHGPRTALDLAQQAACSTAPCYRRWCQSRSSRTVTGRLTRVSY
jgi:hypothetical protein